MKNTWAGINSLINNKRKDFKRISSIIHPDSKVPTTDRSEISNIFNNFFSSVGPNLASKLPSTNREFTDYMYGNFDKSSSLIPLWHQKSRLKYFPFLSIKLTGYIPVPPEFYVQ